MGTEIIRVEATDSDTGLNGDVRFRLKQDSSGHFRTFRIDDRSGTIYLKEPLDREIQKLFEVFLEIYTIKILYNCLSQKFFFFLVIRYISKPTIWELQHL